MTVVFALANQKGGVGKTTTAINLGAYMALKGRRVLLVDIDPQANATSGLCRERPQGGRDIYHVLIEGLPIEHVVRLTNRVGLDLVPSSPSLAGAEVELVDARDREYRLKLALATIKRHYDYVLIDCPPSLGFLTLNALAASDGVIVPVQCEYLALEGLSHLVNTVDLVRRQVNSHLRLAGLVLTMFDPRTNLAHQVVQEVRTHFPTTFAAIIPRSVRLSEAPSYGQSIFEYDPRSKGAQAYAALTDEVLERSFAGG